MIAKVYLKAENRYEDVKVGYPHKPEIEDIVLEKWQHMMNLISKLIDVPCSLIMNITDDSLKVYLKNNNIENPYVVGNSESLGKGFYCETVLAKDGEISIANALDDEIWKDNPDIPLNMIAYYGLPIKWPDDEFFGTICVLDNKANELNEEFKELMKEFRDSIEKDLALIVYKRELTLVAERDSLTCVYNRGKTDELLAAEFDRSKRSGEVFSLVMIDINGFKYINDTYGHDIGDSVLSSFAHYISNRIRRTDYLGRWGGDEFLLVLPFTNYKSAEILMTKLHSKCSAELKTIAKEFSFSYGIASYDSKDNEYDEIVKRADKLMYKMKGKAQE